MIGIITDSTCDLPEELVKKYDITIVPQYIIWGNEQYRDRVDFQPQDFYKRLVTDSVYPTSSQASTEDFKKAIKAVAARGATEVIILTVSSAMSGTYRMAQEAAREVDIPVTVIDGKGPTMSLGWQVLAVARARETGLEVKLILEMIDGLKQRLVQFVCMDSLEYLQKSGRIGNAVKWVGALLKIHPLVWINHSSGLVEPAAMARTHRGVVDLMYTRFFEQLKGRKNMHIAVLHGNVLADGEALAVRIREEFNPVELILNITGPVLGISTGPGALALCGYAEE